MSDSWRAVTRGSAASGLAVLPYGTWPSRGEYGRWLRDSVGALRVRDRTVIEALAGLGVPIATTNYDHLIEEVTGLRAVSWREPAQVERVLRGDARGVLHHTQAEAQVKRPLTRFESEAEDLQGIVQLRMLGQGYDFPPITVVVPMRLYGSFGEFYQFVGRGIRILPGGPMEQTLDVIYHAELGLDGHVDAIHRENEMDPHTTHVSPDDRQGTEEERLRERSEAQGPGGIPHPDVSVVDDPGTVETRVVHDTERPDGFLVLELHGFKDDNASDRMHVRISRSESLHWFDHWSNRFQAMWRSARELNLTGRR